MLKKFLANVLFMLVVTLLAVEYVPNKNPYVFVGGYKLYFSYWFICDR
ncbi:hypothetical protein JFU18_16830 [Bacillus sp. TH22]|nr:MULTISPECIES: hypothetical protein [unclassified Bacillus (in: firmicutes)]MBK5450190.1 hypothetical protein [Bacillus sp. TH22]MBK5456061.1 hypothetical protein [Bacillus sp. TH23]